MVRRLVIKLLVHFVGADFLSLKVAATIRQLQLQIFDAANLFVAADVQFARSTLLSQLRAVLRRQIQMCSDSIASVVTNTSQLQKSRLEAFMPMSV